jgi:cell division protein ZapA
MKRPKNVTLHILDKDYVVACPESEQDDLLASAHYLNDKIQEVRERGKVSGSERLLVMTALNIVHELLQHKNAKNRYTNPNSVDLQRLEQKLQAALDASV